MKVILDVDTGVDDAQAIAVLLSRPDVEILGITCCHGNTPLSNVVKNTLRMLKVFQRQDITVFPGCELPILAEKQSASDYHGKDGMGDVPDTDPPNMELLSKKKAAKAIVKLVRRNPGEVTLVATAPLSNLAVAVQLDPSLPSKLKALYIMGGNIESRGNTSVCGEYNFYTDPEAAHIVLDRYTCPTYIFSWEFTQRNSLPWCFVDKWLSVKTEKAAFMKSIWKLSMTKSQSADYQSEITEGKGFNPCDTFALAAALDNSIITEKEEVAVSVELNGKYTRGMMVLDYMGLLEKKHKAVIVKKVDLDKFKAMLVESVK